MSLSYTVVIPAAGHGVRMQAPCGKPFLSLKGEPVLVHTLRCFLSHPEIVRIVVAVRPEEEDLAWQCKEQVPLPDRMDFHVVRGGELRQDSVAAALAHVETQGVLVHDAVRPFVTPSLLDRLLVAAMDRSAVSLALPVTDTIREVDNQGSSVGTVPRTVLRCCQTPQIFRTDRLRYAHEQYRRRRSGTGASVTDDASLIEALGESVHLVEGDPWNLKLTVSRDLEMAEMILAMRQGGERE